MDPIREEIYKTEEFGRFQSAIAGLAAGRPLVLTGAAGSLKAFLADALRERLGTQILLIAPGEEEAEMLRDDCAALAGDDRVRLLGVRPLHHTQSLDVSGQISQFEAAGALSAGGDLIVAASVRSVAEPLPAPSHFTDSVIKLRKGASHPFEPFIARLGELGFDRKDFVSGYGEFAVRGGIVDVFPFTGSNPVRLEFWGDDVESIREFDPVSQRSIAALEEAVVVPDLTSRDGASGTSVFSYLRNDAVIFLVSPEMIKAEFDELAKEGVATTLTGDALMAEAGKFRLVIAAETVGSAAERGAQTAAAGTVGSAAGATAATVIPFSARPQPAFNGSLSVFLKSAAELTAAGTEVKVLCHDSRDASRLKDLIAGHKETDDAEPGRFTDDTKPVTLPAGKFSIVTGSLHSGFIIGKHAIFTEHGIFGRARTSGSGRRRRFRGISQRELLQLKKGDFVVHEDQGIGTFAGLTRIKVGEVEQEVIRLRFLEDDTLYVNLNYVNRVKKYSSQEGHTPILHRLGGGEWAKIKSRAKRRIKDIARDIIAIYARRKNEKGFAFSPDSHWQLEMEASFMFEDTPDQAVATADVKSDMEDSSPMDRLICGDVGFGKTEIAVRAAFKAVLDGKQVAVLVPTTILAHQHYGTFLDRLSRFSVKIENLTRFRTPAEQKTVVAGLSAGKVDVVIGTHRLLSKDIAFKDLGLLVVDEEHRFGVGAKEKLRKLRASVDTLAMTATPIPRTLQFSLMGSRDLSLITTPPRNRLPVITEIVPASGAEAGLTREVIREAVVRELHRGGQVYVVHDRIQDLEIFAGQIRSIVPEAKVKTAHGQMPGHELEKAMIGFMEKRTNVLVCTKIIESGLDIPNVNTIIIHRADRFGLAELYQLRGRVGRSNVQAHAYLLTPPLATMPKQTIRRLQALEEFSELGSGFNLAMRDLEIRGAGNLLGAEQSGFVADMGFETYERVIFEAVQELKKEEFAGLFPEDGTGGRGPGSAGKEQGAARKRPGAAGRGPGAQGGTAPVETVVETDIEALIPDVYIESDTERLDIYRRLYNIGTDEELAGLKAELVDRFGEYPPEVENLFQVVELRRDASRLSFTKVILKSNSLSITLPPESDREFYGSPVSTGDQGKPDPTANDAAAANSASPFQKLMARVAGEGTRENIRLRQEGSTLTLTMRLSGERIPAALAALARFREWMR